MDALPRELEPDVEWTPAITVGGLTTAASYRGIVISSYQGAQGCRQPGTA